MNQEIDNMIAAKEKALGFGDYDNWKNNHIAELMEEYAEAKIKRFLDSTTKDTGRNS